MRRRRNEIASAPAISRERPERQALEYDEHGGHRSTRPEDEKDGEGRSEREGELPSQGQAAAGAAVRALDRLKTFVAGH